MSEMTVRVTTDDWERLFRFVSRVVDDACRCIEADVIIYMSSISISVEMCREARGVS